MSYSKLFEYIQDGLKDSILLAEVVKKEADESEKEKWDSVISGLIFAQINILESYGEYLDREHLGVESEFLKEFLSE